MNEELPTYRIEIKNSGSPPNENYGWKIYRNLDVLPILHSQQFFVSRMAGLADANQGGNWSISTCKVGQRKSSDPIRDDGHNQSESPPKSLVGYPSGYSPVRTANRATNLRAQLQHGRKTLKTSVDCPRV